MRKGLANGAISSLHASCNGGGPSVTSDPVAVNTSGAPAPVGPYNQAVKAGGWLYCSGQIALDPQSGSLVGAGDVAAETSKPQLTPRESEILKLLAEGLSAKECAVRLGISNKTVHAFRGQLMDKLNLR